MTNRAACPPTDALPAPAPTRMGCGAIFAIQAITETWVRARARSPRLFLLTHRLASPPTHTLVGTAWWRSHPTGECKPCAKDVHKFLKIASLLLVIAGSAAFVEWYAPAAR